jgi:hypothetical protein
MASIERIREFVKGPVDPERFRRREKEGWSLIALEWQRQPQGYKQLGGEPLEEVGYGLRVAGDCIHLEEDPVEMQTLTLMMGLIVRDYPLSKVASELNEKGFRTRQGKLWSPVSVFNMLPRLIELGPKVFSSEDWDQCRQRLAWAM